MRARLLIVATVACWVAYVVSVVYQQFVTSGGKTIRFTIETVSYLLIVTALTASACAYLVARLGAFYRWRSHQRVPRFDIEEHFATSDPSVTVLVPSFREDEHVVNGSLLAAALQEFPHLRVVLLIDDPPVSDSAQAAAQLDAARRAPEALRALLREPFESAYVALEAFERRAATEKLEGLGELDRLAVEYQRASTWLRDLGQARAVHDHSDQFIAEHVLGRLAADLDAVASAVRAAADEGGVFPEERLGRLYRRLVHTFDAEFSSFERKSFASLSHEPNKAMNLNSYIGLMGASYQIKATPAGRELQPCDPELADLHVPGSDYVLTLDADSVVLPEYCLRLVYLLERPENADVGVAQTPYSAYPGAATRLERLAGATTDLQHISHQGMGHYGAAFWVGANAVLRKRAIDDLEVEDTEDGRAVHRYISDRTVIEDTESSIDLGLHGWRIVNYPERLSYSATPPDFGALCIQRERWANGGLLVLGKLRRLLRQYRHRTGRSHAIEGYLRANYLGSIAWSSLGLLFILFYPYPEVLLSPLVVGTAAPYFLAMAADLKDCGYKRTDIFRVYGFNLILAPVNLSGVIVSVGQGLTGRKIAFARTPKVRNRTTARLLLVVMPFLLVAWSAWTLYHDIQRHRWAHALFAAANALLASYGIVAYIGVKNALVDIGVNLIDKLYKPVPRPSAVPLPRDRSATLSPATGRRPLAVDWESVLHYGSTYSTGESEPLPVAAASSSALRRQQRQQVRNGVVGAAGERSAHEGERTTVQGTRRELVPAGSGADDALASALASYLRQMGGVDGVRIRIEGASVTLTPEPTDA